MLKRKEQKLVITIDNVNQADAIALIKMFEYMEYLGNIGASRNCTFFADGDGAFHPKVKFIYPEELPAVPEIDGINYKTQDFSIDSDAIAWEIYH